MSFINDKFILKNKTARKLYKTYAENLPIIDYHCHINPQEIAENKRFENITQAWLYADHYKWRLMRSNGVPEEEITGSADDYTKFLRFAEALPKAIGNPMYHWVHLELNKYFGYRGILNEDTAPDVWEFCNKKIKQTDLSVRGIIKASNVKVIGTTDDPVDSLIWHEKIAEDKSFETKVVPSFRPDKAINIEKAGFCEYIAKLGEAAGMEIKTVADVKTALSKRLQYFCEHGCKASDHGLDYMVYEKASQKVIEETFQNVMSGKEVTQQQADAYKTDIMIHLGREYHKNNVVMQLHYGVIRNSNTKMYEKIGADTGFDCILVRPCGEATAQFLDALDMTDQLPKTILYSLNPQDNAMLDTFIGAFQSAEIAGKIQHGAAWWFNDTKRGMEEHMKSLADLSLLGNFIGMLTDSRSFLSYTRHDYFRRIVCNLLGQWIEDGEYPNDAKAVREIVKGICFENAERYFGF